MMTDYPQIVWDENLAAHAKQLIKMAIAEDLQFERDWTTAALVPSTATGAALFVSRETGVIAGLPIAELVRVAIDPALELICHLTDGAKVNKGTTIATLRGPAASILIAERTMLNFMGRLSGIASLTEQYVQLTTGTKARIYDTRKTTPGWRLLEKYAVQCGGGCNHRIALSAAVLIKDNHLAFGDEASGNEHFTIAQAIEKTREYLAEHRQQRMMIEVEVDSLTQLQNVLPTRPNIVLLDNMQPDQLRAAVAIRDEMNPDVELEASGGVNLTTVAEIAKTGVDRISVGALTHSARTLDIGLDWC
jgi:nicotinate-nucleotide pyrophosphorylase (carboxylating)